MSTRKSKYHPDKKYFALCTSCGENKQDNNLEKSDSKNSEGNILFNNLVGMADEKNCGWSVIISSIERYDCISQKNEWYKCCYN